VFFFVCSFIIFVILVVKNLKIIWRDNYYLEREREPMKEKKYLVCVQSTHMTRKKQTKIICIFFSFSILLN